MKIIKISSLKVETFSVPDVLCRIQDWQILETKMQGLLLNKKIMDAIYSI